MDETQQALVRTTFAKIAPIADQAGAMFYEQHVRHRPGLAPAVHERHRDSRAPS